MSRPTFKGYMDNIQIKTGKTAQDFWKLAGKKGFVKRSKVASKHSEMLAWLKSKDIVLGHVHANFLILCLRLRTDDPKLSIQPRSGLIARDTRITKNNIWVMRNARSKGPLRLNENGSR